MVHDHHVAQEAKRRKAHERRRRQAAARAERDAILAPRGTKVAKVTYEFDAYPIVGKYDLGSSGLGFLSTFKCDSLAEALGEVRKLRAFYRKTGRGDLVERSRRSGIRLFQIVKVTKEPVPRSEQ